MAAEACVQKVKFEWSLKLHHTSSMLFKFICSFTSTPFPSFGKTTRGTSVAALYQGMGKFVA
jgi:hypothetical protein